MRQMQHHGQIADEMQERTENQKQPNHAEDVDDKVCQSGTLRLDVGDGGGEVGGDGGTDVLAHDHGGGVFVANPALGADDQGEGDGRRRGLEYGGEDGSYEEEYHPGAEAEVADALDEVTDAGEVLEVGGHGFLEEAQGEEEQAETDEHLAPVLAGAFFGEEEREGATDDGKREVAHAEFPEPERGDEPAGEGGPDVCSEDDADGADEVHEPRIDEADDHNGGGGGALDEGGDEYARQHAGESVGGHGSQYLAHFVACQFLQGLAHELHAVEEQSQRTDEFQ